VDFADENSVAPVLPTTAMAGFQDPDTCRSILESLQTGVCVVDMQRRIVFWSDGAARITGYLRHEAIGRCRAGNMLLYPHQKYLGVRVEECPAETAIRNAQPVESATSLHHKAGYRIPLYIRAVPVHNEHGSIIGAVESFDDDQQPENSDDREDGLQLAGYADEVTGIANHAMMHSHLRETLGTFAELQVPFGILCLRMEGLAQFRANFSQEAASALLRVFARTLSGALWRTDFVGRWCDDQFLMILNGCTNNALLAVRERIRKMIANDGIEWWGETRTLPISIGKASARPGDALEAMLERVQQSLAADAARDAQNPEDAASRTSLEN
jgi:diguanylate cyclase (GGDEF)-like protein/PAS domain S-box-containing protein